MRVQVSTGGGARRPRASREREAFVYVAYRDTCGFAPSAAPRLLHSPVPPSADCGAGAEPRAIMELATVTLANGSIFEDRYEILGELWPNTLATYRLLSASKNIPLELPTSAAPWTRIWAS